VYFIDDSWYKRIMDKEAVLKGVIESCGPEKGWRMIVIKPEPWNVTEWIYRAYDPAGNPLYVGEYTVSALKARCLEQWPNAEFHVVRRAHDPGPDAWKPMTAQELEEV